MHTAVKAKRRAKSVSFGRRRCFEQMADTELISQCQRGNPVAFEVLMGRYRGAVVGMLRQLAPDWSDTADLAQEAFIRVWRSIGTLRSPFAFKSWLTHLVTNLFYDELRKRPASMIISMDDFQKDDDDDNQTRDLPDLTHLPDEMTQRHELSEAIEHAVDKLPQQFKTVLVLREFDGLSYEEIARLTHTEIGTVKSRISRARTRVQRLLSPFVNSAA